MDPFTAASGIAGLIAVAVKTIHMVGEYVVLVNEHKKHAETLQKELQLMMQVLNQLKNLIDEQRRNDILGSTTNESRNSVLGKAILDCTNIIEQIQEKLREPVNKFKKAMVKLQWPFEQKDIKHMVDNLHRYTQLFQLSSTAANYELLSKTFDAATEGLKLQRHNCKQIEMLSVGFPEMMKVTEVKLEQTETLLKLVPTFLHDISSDMKEIGLAQRVAEQREHGKQSTSQETQRKMFPCKTSYLVKSQIMCSKISTRIACGFADMLKSRLQRHDLAQQDVVTQHLTSEIWCPFI